MIDNYVRTAVRQLVGQKLYSAINIIGLAIGLTCFILIALFVRYELSFDRDYANADRIYRVSRDFFPSDASTLELHLAAIAPQVAGLLKQDFPEIEQVARIFVRPGVGSPVTRDDFTSSERYFVWADNELFAVLDFDWIAGNPETALAEPHTLVLTERLARKYFGDEDPLGQTLTIGDQGPARVTGVIRDLPENTHLRFDALGSIATLASTLPPQFMTVWGNNAFHTYLLLADGADPAALQRQSGAFFERHMGEGESRSTGFTIMPLGDVHLHSRRDGELKPPGSIATIYVFSLVAVAILLIACINFMNLATARSMRRAREVGIRKAIGAARRQLIGQFLGESILIAAIAVVLAAALAELLLPAYSALTQLPLELDYVGNPRVIAGLGALALTVGLLAGSYPAFYLSAFQPTRVLAGDVTRGAAAVAFRRGLVVVQFAVSIALIIATAIVYQQVKFARDIALGYATEQMVVLRATSPSTGLGPQWEVFKQELLGHPEIVAVTASTFTPGQENTNGNTVRVEGGDPRGRQGMPFMFVDYGFFEAYGMKMLAGRTFSREFGTDRMADATLETPNVAGSFILNALAARQFGWTPDEAIGKWFEFSQGDRLARSARGPIIGVVDDVYFESVHNAIRPLVYLIPPERMFLPAVSQASVRVTGRDIPGTLAFVDATWAEFLPGQPIVRRFLDDDFEALYVREERQQQIFTYFALLAIFIACLGLFGLASYTTEQRTKEIGIRKALGGSIWDIVKLFTGEFTRLVLLASLLAWPLAYLFMQRWLENFAYRIEMSALVYLAAGLLALVVAWLTVSGVATRAASAKPVSSLRYE